MVRKTEDYRTKSITPVLLVGGMLMLAPVLLGQTAPQLASLLPEVPDWDLSEDPQSYYPENLFEYINGAAEIYLSYDFHELIVAQYQRSGMESSLAIEIYDMGSTENGFGIYSAERYPENTFIPIGVQGYLEEGSLNFLVGRYYVKLLCFDCGDSSNTALETFAQRISTRVRDKGELPSVLKAFPEQGRLPNTERFILNNVMGYSFLHHGFLANYQSGDVAFDCFVIRGRDEKNAEDMLELYLDAKGKANVRSISEGYQISDKYYQNIFLGRVGRYICGVMKIPTGSEKLGVEYLSGLMRNLK